MSDCSKHGITPMHVLIADGDLAIRLMRDHLDDYQAMAKWLSDERVLEFYEGRDNPFSLEQIQAKYSPSALDPENVTPCLLTMCGNPIGYLQFYPVAEDTETFGIDQFIGQVEFWNRGIGTRAVVLLLHYLFRTKSARKVILDPHVTNSRAIRCYEKCGFQKVRLLRRHELHEGEYRDSWLMEVTPEIFAAGGHS